MNGVPKRIDIRDFVGEEFDEVQRHSDADNPRMRDGLQGHRQMDDAETLQETECRNRSVEVQAGRESGSEGQRKGRERIHG